MGMTPLQREALSLWRQNEENVAKTARLMSRGRGTVRGLLTAALKWEQVETSPGIEDSLIRTKIDPLVATHGWRIRALPEDKHSRDSVFWKLRHPEFDPESFVALMKQELATLQPLPKIPKPDRDLDKLLCNFIPLADLHIGGQYGDLAYMDEVKKALQKLVRTIPKARKAVILELGDLLDANDHKGITPQSGNNCDVIRENSLKNAKDAVMVLKFLIELLLPTHDEVEVHLLRGNHDETAYIAVMMTLEALFINNPRVDIKCTDDEFRVISWGVCGVFPHHGDPAKWEDLKNVFSDQFPEAWAAAKYWRFIWTAHFHHDRQKDIMGAFGEHFRTLSAPNKWAKQKTLFSRGGVQCITLHREDGETDRKKVNLRPLLLEDMKG